MQFNPIGLVEIPVNDIERAAAFYSTLFGFEMQRRDVEGYEMVWFPSHPTAKGITGAIIKGVGYKPGETGIVVYFTVPRIDEIITKAETMGSKVILPKKEWGIYGTVAWITDSEGNIIGLHEEK
jgi:predicted enzyme related to lactoylglutathione lyase